MILQGKKTWHVTSKYVERLGVWVGCYETTDKQCWANEAFGDYPPTTGELASRLDGIEGVLTKRGVLA